MFYEFIRLIKCNRLTKPNITIRPTKRIQMVLGTNGSGKSSLLSIAFSPLPADKNDFFPGGSREVHFTDRGRKFVVIERFADKPWYSFVVDGEEKNDGHTITVQLELVKEYFNYTRELHDFITGQTKFTKLNPQARRDWIARMSEADFSFAFREYERFRKGMSAAGNVVKFLRERINEERKRLLEPNDVIEMRARSEVLRAELRELMAIPRVDSGYYSMADLMDEYNALFNGFDVFSKTEYPRLLTGGKSYEDLIGDLTTRSTELKAIQQERANNITALNQRLGRIKAMMEIDPEALTTERTSLAEKLNLIPAARVELHPSMIVRADGVVMELRKAVMDLPASRTTHHALMEVSDRLRASQAAYDKAENLLNNIQERLHQFSRCEAVQCPSCNHDFIPGVSQSSIDELKDRHGKGSDYVKTVGHELTELQEQFHSADNNYRAYERLDNIRREYSQRYPGVFAYIDSVGGFDLGRGLHEKLALYEREVNLHEQRIVLQRRIDEIQTALDNYEREGSGFQALNEERDVLQRSYNDVFEEGKVVGRDLDSARRNLGDMVNFEGDYEYTLAMVESWKQKLINYLDREATVMADEEISKLQTTLAINETALAEDDLVMTIVKDLEVQLGRKLIEQRAFKRLHDEMSPKTGLIAEQITLQIGAVVGGVNQMLKRVWNHPMYIQLPKSEGVDLDYKFPLVDENRTRSDISKGSDSMLEIVDRAFVMTSYYTLNMTGFPLFLDEPGRTFDETHAQNLIPLVKDLVDSDRFSQILIISHDSDNQRAFPDSEVIIIDDRNINYPHPYNQHVEFEACAA